MKGIIYLADLPTAVMVAAAFGMKQDVFNDAQADTIESLQNRLLDLRDQANNIQARADAEKRDLTEDEQTEIQAIFASFESTEADIERRKKLDDVNARLAAPRPRQTEPNGLQPGEEQNAANMNETRAQAAQRRSSVPAQPRATDTGKWGFRSAGEYLHAVMRASQKGGIIDPRLIANAPSTYGTEGVGADGGFAVPPDFRTTIVSKVMGEGSLLARTDQMTTSSNAVTVPQDATTPWQTSGGILAYWESEAGQKTQSKPALSGLTVKANKLIALVPLTDELLDDAPSMASYVNRKAPEKIDYKINDAIINGSGVGQPLGILTSAGTVTVAAESGQVADTVVYDNIVNMWNMLAAQARPNAVWLANADIEAQLMRMKTPGATTWPAYMPPGGLSVSPYGTLLGRPVITSEAMPKLGDAGDLILGDMSQYLSVVKTGGVRQDVSIHLFFDYDVTAFRFVLRIGGQPWWATGVARTQSQATKGFFVKLGAR
jgi:HK97 family phage major capsid protein